MHCGSGKKCHSDGRQKINPDNLRLIKLQEKTKEGICEFEKILFLVVVSVMMAVLLQCVSAPQRWPAYERRTEDRMFALQQRMGNGLASGEFTPNEAQNLLAKLENIRRDYTVLRERRTTQEEWNPSLGDWTIWRGMLAGYAPSPQESMRQESRIG